MTGVGGGKIRWTGLKALPALALLGGLAACATAPNGPRPMASSADTGLNGTLRPYQVNGVWYTPRPQPHYDEVGLATWYGAHYHHRKTADGELFDMDRASAAHPTLPLPCLVEVTNLENGRRIRVRVNDRGPFAPGRILDLSRQAARDLGFYDKGSAKVRVRYVGPAPIEGGSTVEIAARSPAPPSAAKPVTPVEHTEPRQRVQVGAYADKANAERAVARLASVGQASLESVDRGGARLWRVFVWGREGQEGEALRDSVAGAGFPGARLLGAATPP